MTCCINGGNVIRLLFLSAKLLKFEIQKCGQILCAHKPYFFMPGHNYYYKLNPRINKVDNSYFNMYNTVTMHVESNPVCMYVCTHTYIMYMHIYTHIHTFITHTMTTHTNYVDN